MNALEQQNWIERLIRENAAIERVMDRQTELLAAKDAQIKDIEQSFFDMEGGCIRELARKDAEIARLTALHNERLKAMEAVKIVNETVNQLIFNPFANLQQPAQEQPDEHPAKKGWVNKAVPGLVWLPNPPVFNLKEGQVSKMWVEARTFWDSGAVIAAYERYMQEGGQEQ